MADPLCCPLTMEPFVDPVTAPDGYTYERAAIEEALRRKRESPMTRQRMTAAQLVPNKLVRDLVREKYPDTPQPPPIQSYEPRTIELTPFRYEPNDLPRFDPSVLIKYDPTRL